jgi:hypothetical protein
MVIGKNSFPKKGKEILKYFLMKTTRFQRNVIGKEILKDASERLTSAFSIQLNVGAVLLERFIAPDFLSELKSQFLMKAETSVENTIDLLALLPFR